MAIGPGRIPDKVLRSPWSDAQFEFLQLLSSDFYLDEDEARPDRSSEITYRLIRTRKIEPFTRLLRISFRAANCRVHFHSAGRANNVNAVAASAKGHDNLQMLS